VTITVTCYSWAPSSGDHLFSCGAISRPPQYTEISEGVQVIVTIVWRHKSTCADDHSGGSGGMPPGKCCKIAPKNTHFCAFWKQVLDNTVFTFFYFYVLKGWPWHSGLPLRTLVCACYSTGIIILQIWNDRQTIMWRTKLRKVLFIIH